MASYKLIIKLVRKTAESIFRLYCSVTVFFIYFIGNLSIAQLVTDKIKLWLTLGQIYGARGLTFISEEEMIETLRKNLSSTHSHQIDRERRQSRLGCPLIFFLWKICKFSL